MTEPPESSRCRLLFEHPDAQKVLGDCLDSLVAESDRGAVIVGLDLVDAELGRLFRALRPSSQSQNESKLVFDYPGALSSVASKAAVAFAIRLIDRSLFDSITALRKLRNIVAHSSKKFRLADHHVDLERVFRLGPTVPHGINRLACESLVMLAMHQIKDIRVEVDGIESAVFATPTAALDWLHSHPDIVGILEGRRPRYELGLAVGMICALLIIRRESIAGSFQGDSLLGAALGE